MSRQNKEALEVFKKFLPSLLNNKIPGAKQATSAGELHLSKDTPANGILNPEWSIDKMYAFLRSFDYGGLAIIKQPQLIYGDKRYVWESYSLVPEKSKSNRIILDVHSHSIEIHKAESVGYISLEGVIVAS